MLLEKYHTPVMDRVAALKCTSADVIIASFPKSGIYSTHSFHTFPFKKLKYNFVPSTGHKILEG